MTMTECTLCAGNAQPESALPPRERVRVTEHWRVIAHRSALPGWMLVLPRRHVESLADLTEGEAAELGAVLREGTRALVDAVGANRSYVMQFSEGIRHLHFSLVPRMAELPADRRGAKVGAYNAQDTPLGEEERDRIALSLQSRWP
ncbi:HIT family protein [Occultella kanbiaonis]|uniref:HIT family protein n=1 Tax=Occultella kanbiaonis TaxID=2675754 RepID=UPI0012B9C9EA|nr:HIT family protein [Occultella kanbiaonis]